MKKTKTTRLFLNKVKISKIHNASLLFGGTDAAQPHQADNPGHQEDSHTHTNTETSDSNNTRTSAAAHLTCSLGAGEVTNG